jgi:RNA polymerase sigma-70 factor (ECF subfamily)
MNKSSLDTLLDKLCSGDAVAAEEVFLQFEPYLRKVVRRLLPVHLRSKFDSADIVQSTWSDVLKGFRDAGWQFASVNQLRAFLVKATRNRFIDRFRQQKEMARRQESLTDKALDGIPQRTQPEPEAILQADDLWHRMQDLCPPEHRPILDLKRQGASMEEIAAITGLHPGSVRRILRNLASQMAAQNPGAPGNGHE